MIANLPFPALHASVIAGSYALNSGSIDHDDFTFWLIRYALHAANSAPLDDLADACDRRVARKGLPRDLVAAYSALARLARWRAAQLRGAT